MWDYLLPWRWRWKPTRKMGVTTECYSEKMSDDIVRGEECTSQTKDEIAEKVESMDNCIQVPSDSLSTIDDHHGADFYVQQNDLEMPIKNNLDKLQDFVRCNCHEYYEKMTPFQRQTADLKLRVFFDYLKKNDSTISNSNQFEQFVEARKVVHVWRPYITPKENVRVNYFPFPVDFYNLSKEERRQVISELKCVRLIDEKSITKQH